MPVVINEIVFKATIADSRIDSKPSSESGDLGQLDKKALVDICVEEVLNILEREKER